MWNTILDLVIAAADWPWLEPLTTLARALAAVIALIIAICRAVRYRRRCR